jgi:hypothetical protein
MCFVAEYDWSAEFVLRSTKIVGVDEKRLCLECYRPIVAGQTYYHVFAQEHEECRDCTNGLCDCPKDDDDDCTGCKCDTPNFGEDCEYWTCEECHKFIEAVSAAEIEAGCEIGQSKPMAMQMMEDIGNGDMDEAKKYWKMAVKMYPELRASGYLAWLWQKVF